MPDLPSGPSIIHVLTSVDHGGAERVVLELARSQRRRGANVRVLCLQQLGGLLPEFEAAQIPVRLVEGSRNAGALRMAWRVAGELAAAMPAIVHTHNSAPQIAAGLGQWLRRWRRGNAPLVHTEHGRVPETRGAILRLRRWTARVFDRIVAVSSDARNQLLSHGIGDRCGVDVILNGVDVERFEPGATHAHGTSILHIGRLSPIKGQDVLIASLPQVRASIPSVQVTIVGDGPARQQLEAEAKAAGVDDCIDFVGAQENVLPYLQSHDLFVLPSRSEGISIALLEAMATGLPVVATDVGGNREVIRSDEVGRLVPSENPGALADAMTAILANPGLGAAMGTSARREVEARFTTRMTTQAYDALYHDARPRRPS